MLKAFLILCFFVVIVVASFTFWTRVLDSKIPSWGGLYDSSTPERKLAESIEKETKRWRVDRVLPDLRHEDTLCPYALRRAKEVAKDPFDRAGLQRMVNERTMVLQTEYAKVSEVVGTGTSAVQMLQEWSERFDDREVIQDKHLTHHCVRCSGNVCAQLLIEQK